MSISLDGFVAGPEQSREGPLGKRGRELHGWHLKQQRLLVAPREVRPGELGEIIRESAQNW